jgi:hypothetical protein
VIENQEKGKSENGGLPWDRGPKREKGKWAEELAFEFYSRFLIQTNEV